MDGTGRRSRRGLGWPTSLAVIIVAAFAGLAAAEMTSGGDPGLDLRGAGSAVGPSPPVPPPPPPAADKQAPRVKISGRRNRRDRRPKFWLRANEPGVAFICKIGDHRPRPCTSPFKAPDHGGGHHVLIVIAIDAAGNRSMPVRRHYWVRRNR